MTMLYLLLTILTIEYIIGYRFLKDREIGAPSLILCVMMIASTALAIIGSKLYWQIDIHANTVFYFSISVFLFLLSDLIINFLYARKKRIIIFKPKYINVDFSKLAVISMIGCLTLALQWKNVVSTVGLKSISKMLFAYRTAYNAGDTEPQSGLLSQLVLVTTISAYVFIYIFAYNFIYYRKKKKNYFNLIPVFILCVSGLLDGARGKLVNLVLSGVFFFYYFYQQKHGWKKKDNRKLAKKIAIIGVIGVIAFVRSGELLGRNQYDFGPMFEICEYAGGEIILLDLFVNQKIPAPKGMWGQSTFENIYNYLGDHFGLEVKKLDLYTYRTSNNVPLGNVYTGLLPWYHDFGAIGIIVLSLIFGLVFSFWYRKLNRMDNEKRKTYWLLMYGYFINCLFLFLFNDRFFSRLGPQLLRLFVYFWIIKVYIIDFRFVRETRS